MKLGYMQGKSSLSKVALTILTRVMIESPPKNPKFWFWGSLSTNEWWAYPLETSLEGIELALDRCLQQVTHVQVDVALLVVVSDRRVCPFSFQVNSLHPLPKVSLLLYLQPILQTLSPGHCHFCRMWSHQAVLEQGFQGVGHLHVPLWSVTTCFLNGGFGLTIHKHTAFNTPTGFNLAQLIHSLLASVLDSVSDTASDAVWNSVESDLPHDIPEKQRQAERRRLG